MRTAVFKWHYNDNRAGVFVLAILLLLQRIDYENSCFHFTSNCGYPLSVNLARLNWYNALLLLFKLIDAVSVQMHVQVRLAH